MGKLIRTFKAKFEMNQLKDSLIIKRGARRTTKAFFLPPKMTPGNFNNIIDLVVKQASWLNDKQRDAIITAVKSLGDLSLAHKKKLFKILVAIPYSEIHQDAHGKKMTFIISNVWNFFKSSLGTWQLNTKHAHLFNLSKDEFKLMLNDDDDGVNLIIRFLVEQIGLDKAPEKILFEYNYGINASLICPMQKIINLIRKHAAGELKDHEEILSNPHIKNFLRKKIKNKLEDLDSLEKQELTNWPILSEDGFMGEDTKKAWRACLNYLQIEIMEEKEDEQIRDFLKHFNEAFPDDHYQIKNRDFRFFISNLRRGKIRRALSVLSNNVNAKEYVSSGMKAYNFISKFLPD